MSNANWSEYVLEFELLVERGGVMVILPYNPTSGRHPGFVLPLGSLEEVALPQGQWVKMRMSLEPRELSFCALKLDGSELWRRVASSGDEQEQKGGFAFGILQGQKVRLRNVRIKVIR
jgi:hypothetical protein